MPLVVNGQTIDDAVIEQEFSTIKAHYESLGSISCCERDDEFRGYARDNITFRALLTQEAQRTIPEPGAEEVSQAFDRLKEEHGGDDQFYASMGLSPEQDELIQRDLSVNLQVESLRDSACQSLSAPTEAECRGYYDSNIEQFSDEDEVRASHIFKSVRETEKREAIFKALCEVRQQLVDGADFTEVARQHSDKPAEEIDLGYFKRGELMDVLDEEGGSQPSFLHATRLSPGQGHRAQGRQPQTVRGRPCRYRVGTAGATTGGQTAGTGR